MKPGTSAIVGLLTLPLAACWTSAKHGDLIDQRLKALEADDQDHQAALDAQRKLLAAQLPKIDQKIQQVTEALDRLNTVAHRSGADAAARLDDLQEKLQQLQGGLDEARHQIQQLSSGAQAVASSVDQKLAQALGSKAMAQVTAREKAAKLAPADRPGLYAVAFKEYKGSDWDVARELYREYLRRYPNDPQAGDAQFYVGDCLLQAGEFKEAALAFQKVSDSFPKSDHVCESRLKLGESLAALKMRDEARLAFEDTLKRCGGKLAVAKKAKGDLVTLSRGTRHTKH
ncbi:MAG: tetratricopeptide repeat protein [Myxococcales bacterium]